jgi:hypothetical protein
VYTYYVWVNDTAGSAVQTGTRTITIDTTNPLVKFIPDTSADDAQITSVSQIVINVSHTDTNLDTLRLERDGQNYTYSFFTNTFTTITETWAVGVHNYIAYVNDTAGNLNSTEMRNVTFYILPPRPPPAPGSVFSGSSGGWSPPACTESWECTDWSAECVDFEYERTCTDINECGTEKTKPAERIACALAPDETPAVPQDTICTSGDTKCSGSNVVECNSEGTAWRLLTSCENGCENAACKDPTSIGPSGGELGLTGMFVGAGANAVAVVAGILIIAGGLFYYFRIRRFRLM